MTYENKQGNQLLYLVCYIVLKLYEQVIGTVWPFNTGQDNRRSPVGTSQMLTATATGRNNSRSREAIFITVRQLRVNCPKI